VGPDRGGLSIDELLDRAVRAINRGDRETATALAGQVLAVDHGNPEAEDLLAASAARGEIRRLTLMFVDLVDSTVLSTRLEPEAYHTLVGRYREEVVRLVNQYEGHISSAKGDGLLVMFGHPRAHEDDARRAVMAGLDITRAVARLSERAERRFGTPLSVRVGVHRGVVYLDRDEDDVYGFAANLVQRIQSLAEPGSVAVSDAAAALVDTAFELEACAPARVKGVDEPVSYHRVLAERIHAPSLRAVPLIGRDHERMFLERAWHQTSEGTPTCRGVAFHGEPGIGKTRLARAAVELAEGSESAVVVLNGSPLHTDTGLYPVRRLLERRCGITRFTDGPERLRLLEAELAARALDPATTVPLLAPVLGVGPEHGYRPAAVEGLTLYQLIGTAAFGYIAACMGDRPGLIVAEDVHWFDPSTSELLNAILTAPGADFLVVLTGRDGPWLQNDWPITTFELSPLSDEESDRLIDALNPTVTDAQRAAVRRRCDGIPFYIEHVVAGLDESGAGQQVPEALYEPLLARLHARRDVVPVVEAAAVIGRSGDVELLRAVTEDQAEVDRVIPELVKARIFETRDDRWQFRHELLREVAVELAPPSLQRELHARVARALVEGSAGSEPDWRVVARHLELAERFGDAVDAYRKASVDARRRGAAMEACGYLSNALNQLSSCAPGPERDRTEIAIRLERGLLMNAAQIGTVGEGPADFERALELATSGMHEDELFSALAALISYYMQRAELRRLRELLESLSGRVTADRPWRYPAIASSTGTTAFLEGDFPTARTDLMQALGAATDADPRELDDAWWVAADPIAASHIHLALTELICGAVDRSDLHLAAASRRCDELGYPKGDFGRAHGFFAGIWVGLETGDLDRAAADASDLRKISEQAGLDMWQFVSKTQYATVKAHKALRSGADPQTLAASAENIALRVDASRQMHFNLYLTCHDTVIARLLIAAGRSADARARIDMALEHAQHTGMRFYDAELLRVRAHTFTEQEARRDALGAALTTARKQCAQLFELRCLLDFFELLGDGDRAELQDALRRFPDTAGWPEHARAEHILSGQG